MLNDPRLPPRFWTKVGVNEAGCWLWLASLDRKGYSKFSVSRSKWSYAHRVAYEALVGPIPEGLGLDHRCRTRSCVNPAHLEPVTTRINLLRGESPSAKHATKRACPHGHPYDTANTYRYRGMRYCRECMRARNLLRRSQ